MKHKVKLIFLSLFMIISIAASAQASDQEIMKEIQAMKARIAELEAKVAQYERKDMADDDGRAHGGSHDNWVIKSGHDHAHLDIHSIQVHGGLDYRYLDVENSDRKSFLHEAEIGVSAQLSDWINAHIAFTKHHGEDAEIEEAYGTLKLEEIASQVKAGKFFVNFGPENRVGFYDRRTITPSAMREGFFGEENWSDEGAEFTYRLPVDFYSTFSLSALNGNNANTFGDEVAETEVDNNNLLVALNSSNEFEFDWGEIRLGSSYARGKWDASDKYDVQLFGFDTGTKIGRFEFQGEYMFSKKENASGTDELDDTGFNVWGAYVHPVDLKYLKEVELLFAYSQFDPDSGTTNDQYTPQISFQFNDFVKIRLMYQFREEEPADIDNDRFIAQFAYHF